VSEKNYYRFPGSGGIKKHCTEEKAKAILKRLQMRGCPAGTFELITREEFKKKEKEE